MILKYLYPKPRKKTLFVLLVLVVIVTVLFSVQRTSHRKHIKNLLEEISIANTYIKDDGTITKVVANKNDEKEGGEIAVERTGSPPHYGQIKPGFNAQPSRLHAVQNVYNITVEISKSVLVFTGSEKSVTKDKLKFLFKSMKITFDFLVWNNVDDYYTSMPRFIDKYGNPRYQTFVFTNENIFDDFDAYNWDLIKRHCTEFNTGIIILCYPTRKSVTVKSKQLKMLPLTFLYGMNAAENLRGVELPANEVLKLVKTPNLLEGQLPGKKHVFFHTRHETFKDVMFTNIAQNEDDNDDKQGQRDDDNKRRAEVHLDGNKTLHIIDKFPLALYDQGRIDGVRKFIFGVSFWESWLYELVLVDALQIVSNGNLGNDLQRYIQVDVDDIFVGKTGRRLVKEDIEVC